MVFTVDQIKEAQAKVKTGADFPNYAKQLATIGVKFYETFLGMETLFTMEAIIFI